MDILTREFALVSQPLALAVTEATKLGLSVDAYNATDAPGVPGGRGVSSERRGYRSVSYSRTTVRRPRAR